MVESAPIRLHSPPWPFGGLFLIILTVAGCGVEKFVRPSSSPVVSSDSRVVQPFFSSHPSDVPPPVSIADYALPAPTMWVTSGSGTRAFSVDGKVFRTVPGRSVVIPLSSGTHDVMLFHSGKRVSFRLGRIGGVVVTVP